MRPLLPLIAIGSLVLNISQIHAEILLDEVMSKEDQKKTGVANLSLRQKIALEHWINQTFILKSKQTAPEASPKPEDENPLTLSINIDGGHRLELSDNSIWEVAPNDIQTSSGWLLPFPVKITPNNDPNYPFTLLNINTGASVKVRKVSPLP